jgi:hypothetical protein
MTNPTSNFGWQMPTSTDLVTDLPADFETFGQAVDTSLAELKGGTTGQVLSKTSNTDMDFTWVTSDDANAIQNTIVDAKGDLIGATAADTPARLAVGANGTVLVADSTEATGLKWALSGNFVGCRVYASSAQTISNATDTTIAFANESYDTDGFHSNVTNNTRLTIPAGLAGYYRVTASIGWEVSGVGRRIYAIKFNGGGYISQGELTPGAGTYPVGTITDTFYFNVNDIVELNVYQTTGGNFNTSGSSVRDYLEIERVGS